MTEKIYCLPLLQLPVSYFDRFCKLIHPRSGSKLRQFKSVFGETRVNNSTFSGSKSLQIESSKLSTITIFFFFSKKKLHQCIKMEEEIFIEKTGWKRYGRGKFSDLSSLYLYNISTKF